MLTRLFATARRQVQAPLSQRRVFSSRSKDVVGRRYLTRLRDEKLGKVVRQGKHRYFTLYGVEVAAVLEGLLVLSGGPRDRFIPKTPNRLRMARTCYDHMAGTLGVSLHDCMVKSQWLVRDPNSDDDGYTLTSKGEKEFLRLGVDMKGLRATRRRFASQCIDWSERRPHLGGGVGAAIFTLALKRKWVSRDLDSRILSLTSKGLGRSESALGLICPW
jgi:hypothetical protein